MCKAPYVHMFSHIRPPLNLEESRIADHMVAVSNMEPGWINRSMIADEIKRQQAILKAAREPQRKLQFQQAK